MLGTRGASAGGFSAGWAGCASSVLEPESEGGGLAGAGSGGSG